MSECSPVAKRGIKSFKKDIGEYAVLRKMAIKSVLSVTCAFAKRKIHPNKQSDSRPGAKGPIEAKRSGGSGQRKGNRVWDWY